METWVGFEPTTDTTQGLGFAIRHVTAPSPRQSLLSQAHPASLGDTPRPTRDRNVPYNASVLFGGCASEKSVGSSQPTKSRPCFVLLLGGSCGDNQLDHSFFR